MECNKEEAWRAKEIAERKMQDKDFLGAKKIVLKAQQLYPELENVSQMLTVCEVHCCAAAKVNGELDWYEILQVEQVADESSIKKQYRKLALQLHPDKNKFAGAEAAFKLIGEAHMTLSDRGKRCLYDIKRRSVAQTVLPRKPSHPPPNKPCFPKAQPGFGSTASFHYGSNIHQQQSSSSISQVFQTMCPSCCHKYSYPRTLINRQVRCNRCLNNFDAYESPPTTMPASAPTFAEPWNHTQNLKQEIPGQKSHNSCNTGFQGNVAGIPTAQKSRSSSCTNVAHGCDGSSGKEKQDGIPGNNLHFEKVNFDVGKKTKHHAKDSTVKAKRKRGRKVVVESSDSDSSTDSEDLFTEEEMDSPAEQNTGTIDGRYPRRSNRPRQNYNEAKEDDDFATPKRLKKGGLSSNTVNGKANSVDADDVCNNNDAKHTGDSSSDASPVQESFSYPDPEFGNFEGERVESKFETGQIWAAYDNLDAMPRFYARIKEVRTKEFRLHFTWLEHNAVSATEMAWNKAELPVACGRYRLGKSGFAKSLQMFSHLMCWEKGTQRNTFNIYPRKGEVWALFKGWDVVRWSSNGNKFHDYEVVEVLSDFADSSDILVHPLVKIQGFLSLFTRAMDKGTYMISSTEVLRFSHNVPSYRLTGDEREGALQGCLELDLASLPSDSTDTFPSISPDDVANRAEFNDTFSNPCRTSASDEENVAAYEVKSTGHGDQVNGVAPTPNASAEHPIPSPQASIVQDTFECPDNEFHDFEEDKSIEKFQKGQIWALYSEVDEYPKYYAKIRNVKGSKIHVSWAELCPQRMDENIWSDKGLLCACGRFKIERGIQAFETNAFSHLVHAKPTGKRDEYDICPRVGDVWALYKDWSIKWTQADLDKCDYDVVEVLEHTDSGARVLVLTKVDDHIAVFKPESKGAIPQMLEIPWDEILRFSHQIPAFRLTDLESSEVHGYWELHSLSLPRNFL